MEMTLKFEPVSLLGRTLDEKYLMEEQLGVGGMGLVFRAQHVGTQRRVAVKVMAADLMQSAEYLERFKREARAAGRLQHPNIVNVTDFGVAEEDGHSIPYLAMEYLEGFTLSRLLGRSGALPLIRAIDILEQVAIAIEQAHDAGIVHRDLKPDNIWLRPDGRGQFEVKVLDFGVASVRELSAIAAIQDLAAEETVRIGGSPESRPTVSDIVRTLVSNLDDEKITRSGSVIGTPAYMSPEQCTGLTADARSDIYSLGVIAFQMITGRLPYAGDTIELIAKHIAAPPPDPRDIVRNLPRGVAEILISSLAKDPALRPPSAMVFAGALRARSEGATMVLRRAVAVTSLHADEFLKVAAIAAAPVLIVAAAVVVGAAAVMALFPPETRWLSETLLGFISILFFFALSIPSLTAALALFGVANETLRVRPFDRIEAPAVMREVLLRLGHEGEGTTLDFWRNVLRVSRLFFRWTPADEFLAVLAMVLNGQGTADALHEARQEAKALPRSRDFVLLMTACALFAPPLLVLGLLRSARVEDSIEIAAISVAVALGALLSFPLMATAYSILHFRARQALGRPTA